MKRMCIALTAAAVALVPLHAAQAAPSLAPAVSIASSNLTLADYGGGNRHGRNGGHRGQRYAKGGGHKSHHGKGHAGGHKGHGKGHHAHGHQRHHGKPHHGKSHHAGPHHARPYRGYRPHRHHPPYRYGRPYRPYPYTSTVRRVSPDGCRVRVVRRNAYGRTVRIINRCGPYRW